jgi:hypothetical protein
MRTYAILGFRKSHTTYMSHHKKNQISQTISSYKLTHEIGSADCCTEDFIIILLPEWNMILICSTLPLSNQESEICASYHRYTLYGSGINCSHDSHQQEMMNNHTQRVNKRTRRSYQLSCSLLFVINNSMESANNVTITTTK